MTSIPFTPYLDLIEELRLRRWARENYVPQEVRPESWHPVILDEMGRHDAEPLEEVDPPTVLLRPKLRRENVLSLRRDDTFVT